MTGKELKTMLASIPDESSVNISIRTSGADGEWFNFKNFYSCEVTTKGDFEDADNSFEAITNIAFTIGGVEIG